MLVQLKVFNVELDKFIENETMNIRQDYLDYLLETILETKNKIIILSDRNFKKEEKNVRNNRRNANKTN